MKQRKNRTAVSTVCLIQLAVCGVLLLAVLLWKTIGGGAYDAAAGWYRDAAGDSVLVSPEVLTSGGEESHA